MPTRGDQERRDIEASLRDAGKKPKLPAPTHKELTGPEKIAQNMPDDDSFGLTQGARQATRQGTPAAPSDPDSAWSDIEQFATTDERKPFETPDASGDLPTRDDLDFAPTGMADTPGAAKDITNKFETEREKAERFDARMADYVAWKVWRPPYKHFTPEVATGMGGISGLSGVSEGVEDTLKDLFGHEGDPKANLGQPKSTWPMVPEVPGPALRNPQKAETADQAAIRAEMEAEGADITEINRALSQQELVERVDERGLNASRVAEFLGASNIAKEYKQYIRFDASRQGGKPEPLLKMGDIIVAVNGMTTSANYEKQSYSAGQESSHLSPSSPKVDDEDLRVNKRNRLGADSPPPIADFGAKVEPELLDAEVPFPDPTELVEKEEAHRLKTAMQMQGVSDDQIQATLSSGKLMQRAVARKFTADYDKLSRLPNYEGLPPKPQPKTQEMAAQLAKEYSLNAIASKNPELAAKIYDDLELTLRAEALSKVLGIPAFAPAGSPDIVGSTAAGMLRLADEGDDTVLKAAIRKWQERELALRRVSAREKLGADADRSAQHDKRQRAADKIADTNQFAKGMGDKYDIVKPVPRDEFDNLGDDITVDDLPINEDTLPILEIADDDFQDILGQVPSRGDETMPGLFSGQRGDPASQKRVKLDPRHSPGGLLPGEPANIRIGSGKSVPGSRAGVRVARRLAPHNRLGMLMIREATSGSYDPSYGELEEINSAIAPVVTIIRAPSDDPEVHKQLSALGYPDNQGPYIEVAKAQFIGSSKMKDNEIEEADKALYTIWYNKLQTAQDLYDKSKQAFKDGGFLVRNEFEMKRLRSDPKPGESAFWKKSVKMPVDSHGLPSAQKLDNLKFGDKTGVEAAHAMLMHSEMLLREVATDAIKYLRDVMENAVPEAGKKFSQSKIAESQRAGDLISRISRIMEGDTDLMFSLHKTANRAQDEANQKAEKSIITKLRNPKLGTPKSEIVAAVKNFRNNAAELKYDADSFRFAALANALTGRLLAKAGLSTGQFEKSFHSQHPGEMSLKALINQMSRDTAGGVVAGRPVSHEYWGHGKVGMGRYVSDPTGSKPTQYKPMSGQESVTPRAALVESLKKKVEIASGADAATTFYKLASSDPRKIIGNLSEGMVLLFGFGENEKVLNGLSAKILEHNTDGLTVEIVNTPKASIIHEDDRKIFVNYDEVIVVDGKLSTKVK